MATKGFPFCDKRLLIVVAIPLLALCYANPVVIANPVKKISPKSEYKSKHFFPNLHSIQKAQSGSIQDVIAAAKYDLEAFKDAIESAKVNKLGHSRQKEDYRSILNDGVLENSIQKAAVKDAIESAKGNKLGIDYRSILNADVWENLEQEAVKDAIESAKGNKLGKVDYRSILNADVWGNPEQEEFKNDIKWQKRSLLGETKKNDIEAGTDELDVGTFGNEHMDSGTAKQGEEADTKEELDTGTGEETDNFGGDENEQRAETFKDIESEPLHAKTNGKELLEKETPKSINLMLDTGTEDKGNNYMLEKVINKQHNHGSVLKYTCEAIKCVLKYTCKAIKGVLKYTCEAIKGIFSILKVFITGFVDIICVMLHRITSFVGSINAMLYYIGIIVCLNIKAIMPWDNRKFINFCVRHSNKR